jgi:hypothetical protein
MGARLLSSLDQLSTNLRAVVEEVRIEHERLAESPTITPSRVLADATAKRERIIAELGRVVSEAMLRGSEVAFGEEGPATASPPIATTDSSPIRRTVTHRRSSRGSEVANLNPFIEQLQDTEDIETLDQLQARYRSVRAVAGHPDRWAGLDARVQRHLLGATVAILRDLQEANDEFDCPLREPEIVGLVSRLSHWSKEHRPGWVNGMARGAEPQGDSWLDDAEFHLDALRTIIVDAGGAAPERPATTPAVPATATEATAEPGPLDQPCSACGASPGERCKSESGRTLYSFQHKDRR